MMKCYDFKPLINDMTEHSIEKEHYNFSYNGFVFDVILAIVNKGYELLIAIHSHNWGCVLYMNDKYDIDVPDDIYYSLRTLLNLNWSKDHFSSPVFLPLLSENAPNHSNLIQGFR